MTTPNQMISDALGLVGVRAIGESLPGHEVLDCYRVFQRMLDEMAIEKLIQRWEGATTFGTSSGQSEYEITSTESTPVGVSSLGFTSGDGDSWIGELAQKDDLLSVDRDVQGRPSTFTPMVKNRALTITLWPTPDGSYSVIANLMYGLYFSDLNDDILLPVGYESMLVQNLAVKLAPLYEREAPASVVMGARSSKSLVKRMNWQGITVQNDMIGMVR